MMSYMLLDFCFIPPMHYGISTLACGKIIYHIITYDEGTYDEFKDLVKYENFKVVLVIKVFDVYRIEYRGIPSSFRL
jgi:hypothetical protein